MYTLALVANTNTQYKCICSPALSTSMGLLCSAVLLWVKLSFFASKLVALRTFNQSHSCRFFCEAYILSHIDWLDLSHCGTRLHFWPLLCDSAWESYLAMINKKQLLRQFTTSNQTAWKSLILMHPFILPIFVDHPSSKAPLPLI